MVLREDSYLRREKIKDLLNGFLIFFPNTTYLLRDLTPRLISILSVKALQLTFIIPRNVDFTGIELKFFYFYFFLLHYILFSYPIYLFI